MLMLSSEGFPAKAFAFQYIPSIKETSHFYYSSPPPSPNVHQRKLHTDHHKRFLCSTPSSTPCYAIAVNGREPRGPSPSVPYHLLYQCDHWRSQGDPPRSSASAQREMTSLTRLYPFSYPSADHRHGHSGGDRGPRGPARGGSTRAIGHLAAKWRHCKMWRRGGANGRSVGGPSGLFHPLLSLPPSLLLY